MRSSVIVFLIILLLVGACFIPVSYQKSTSIKANFYNVYQRLSNYNYWKFWYDELKEQSITPKNLNNNEFEIRNKNLALHVNIRGNVFSVSEVRGNAKTNYNYLILSKKFTDSTIVVTERTTSIISYLLDLSGIKPEVNYMDRFKFYMETPKLYYGFDIVRKKLTDTDILVLKTLVLSKNQFEEAEKSLVILHEYLVKNQLKQTQPLIAQFLQKGHDSTEVKVGVPVDRKVNPKNPIQFSTMPKTYSLYTLYYRGLFKDKVNAYTAVQNFYKDRNLQMPFAPLEIYLDNKLPASENDTVYIEIQCPTY